MNKNALMTYIPTSSHQGMFACDGETGQYVRIGDYKKLRNLLSEARDHLSKYASTVNTPIDKLLTKISEAVQ